MRSIPEEFRPVMVETLAETAGAAAAAEIGTALGTMDLEALRIIARMSPEQIDALTLLILSQSPEGAGPPGGAPPAATGTEARWVGDWTEGTDAAGDATAGPWSVRETRDGRILILHSEDPLSRLEVEAGLVLGHFGKVTRISRGPAQVEVETASGTVLRGPREGAPVVAAPLPAPAVEEARLSSLAPRPRPERKLQPAAAPVATAEPAPQPSVAAMADGVAIQAATFSIPDNARAAAAALTEAGLPALVEGPVAGGLHRVLVGPVPRGETASALARLAETGYRDAFVLTVPTILTR
jgi:cell division septation protein DedD